MAETILSNVMRVGRVGLTNTANAVSMLTGSATGPSRRIDNNSTDANATALDLRVEPGKPPMTVGSDAKVTNLDADELDGNPGNHVFAGPTASINTDANDRLTGAAVAPMGLSTGSQNADVGLCYRSTASGSTAIDFVGGSFSVHFFSKTRETYPASATTVPGAGTYNVGMRVRNNGPSPINNLVNGWVMVTDTQ